MGHTAPPAAATRVRGFTLLELMIAMALGIVLITGAFGIVASSSATREKTEAGTEMLGATRMIAGVISDDIRHAGMFGRVRGALAIEGRLGATNELPAIADDCDDRFYIDLEQYIFATNGNNPWAATCIGGNHVAGTDILAVKFTDIEDRPHADWATLPEDSVYLFSNPSGGRIFWRGTNPPTTIGYGAAFAAEAERMIQPLRVHIYYLSEPTADVPFRSLRRLGLNPDAGPLYSEEIIATGVENFQVQFGVEDCDSAINPCQGIVTEYRPADVIDWTSNSVIDRIRAIQVLTVAGSDVEERPSAETRTYQFGGQNFTATANLRVWQGTFQVRNSL
ncbi:MAG: PilW family protein [Pseudomonadota bacterium]